jgi:hypothetical protein
MRSVAFSVIRNVEFGTAVVCPVAVYCISRLLELWGHGTSRRCHSFGRQTRRVDCCQPVKVLLAGVDAIGTVAVCILREEFPSQLNEPPIIIE